MHAISIKNLTKKYADGKLAIDNINLEIKQGEFFGLLGQNGAGKTTTIGILTGLINKTAGEVSILGYDLVQDYRIVKSKIGLMPQEFNFDPFFSLYDLLVYQAGYFGIKKKKAVEITEKLLKEFGLWEDRKKTMRQISGGMKRRLLLAKALVNNPEILILDEPTAGIDVELRKKLWQLLRDFNKQGKTIILTTHYLEEAEELCERIAIIDHGRIIEIDTKNNLMHKFRQDEISIVLKTSLSAEVIQIIISSLKFSFKDMQYLLEKNQFDNQLTVITTDANKKLSLIIEKIGSINIDSVSVKQRNLEDIFMKLTTKTILQK